MRSLHPQYWRKSLKLILKVDESWSFVQAKKHPRWLWWVEDAVTGRSDDAENVGAYPSNRVANDEKQIILVQSSYRNILVIS